MITRNFSVQATPGITCIAPLTQLKEKKIKMLEAELYAL
jgi:hypothetical protein